tara:strand:+ start:1447 stop:1791 length:345 start_codon:yes stop_codon:yes gene_type:complete
MAIYVDADCKLAGFQVGLYARFWKIIVQKNYADNTWQGVGFIATYSSKEAADDRIGSEMGGAMPPVEPRQPDRFSGLVKKVKARDIDLNASVLNQLYTQLKADLTEAGIAWREE